jgi:ribulose-5-phosphate 4-epimerase/fuculose-1-phosphate aldolase
MRSDRITKPDIPPFSMSTEEWQARLDLAAMYRLVHHFRMTDTIYTHISMRLPGATEAFLINPFGLLYDEITASNLVKVTVDGDILDDPVGLGINQAGFVIHGAIHAARPDVHVVLHTHTNDGVAVAIHGQGVLPLSQHTASIMRNIAYHAFEGIAVDLDEQERLVKDLGLKRMMILNDHGLLTAGRSAAETFGLMLTLQRACEIQVAAFSCGPVRTINEAALASTKTTVEAAEDGHDRQWDALVRMLDRMDSGFRA